MIPGRSREHRMPMPAKDPAMCIKACSEAAQLGNEVHLLPADITNRATTKWKNLLKSKPNSLRVRVRKDFTNDLKQ